MHIRGFKSIRDAEIDFGPLNVLIGANGAGKSNLISWFGMLEAAANGRLEEFVAESGGAASLLYLGQTTTREIFVELVLAMNRGDITLKHRFVLKRPDSLYVLSHSPKLPGKGTASMHSFVGPGYLNIFEDQEIDLSNGKLPAEAKRYHFNNTSRSAAIRGSCYLEDNEQLRDDGGNLASMLYLYQKKFPDTYSQIVRAVKKVIPPFEEFDLLPRRHSPDQILLNWRQHGSELLGPHQFSDGALRVIALIALLLQPQEDLPDILIVDEPELGLHPQALELVAGLFRAVSAHTQVIVATQSESFLAHFDASEVIVAETGDAGTSFRRLACEDLAVWLEDYSLGELWRRNVIGGGPIR